MSFKEYHLKEYPKGTPGKEIWSIHTAKEPSLHDNEYLVKVEYLSLDPYMRDRMQDKGSSGSMSGFHYPLNTPVPTLSVGKVVQSKNEKYKVGDFVSGFLSLSEYHVAKAEDHLQKIDPNVPHHFYLTVFGGIGVTAYQGVTEVLEVKKGDNFLVNAASGAVGTVAGRIAKLRGAYVVGVTSDDEKAKVLKEKHGFDEVINYKKHDNHDAFLKALKEVFPKGIDKYFDNVGGYQTDSAIKLINHSGRIAVCGQISQYNSGLEFPKFGLAALIYTNIRIEGFIVTDFLSNGEKMKQFVGEMGQWVGTGKVTSEETIFDGFETIPEAFLSLFNGKKTGKVIVKLH